MGSRGILQLIVRRPRPDVLRLVEVSEYGFHMSYLIGTVFMGSWLSPPGRIFASQDFVMYLF